MIENHPTKGLYDNKPVFGIKELIIDSGVKGIAVKPCDEGNEDKTNKWIFEEV